MEKLTIQPLPQDMQQAFLKAAAVQALEDHFAAFQKQNFQEKNSLFHKNVGEDTGNQSRSAASARPASSASMSSGVFSAERLTRRLPS